MKPHLLLLPFMFLPLCLGAKGDDVALLQSSFKNHRITADYSYTIRGMTDVKVEGKAVVQDSCFRMEGAGLLIVSDAVNTWTLDLEGKEAYIEKAGPFDYMKYVSEVSLNEEDGSISGTYEEPLSGSLIPFIISNIKLLPRSGDLSPFSPGEDVFKGDWIITDLR